MCVEPPLGELKPAPMEPLKIKEIYQPVDVREVETGVWQYDLGKNFSGWARIFLKTDGSRAGQKVVLKTAEKLDENGRIDQSVTCLLYTSGTGYVFSLGRAFHMWESLL